MLKRPWWIIIAAAGIAVVLGMMFGGGTRTTPKKSNEAGNTRVGPAGFEGTGAANSRHQPTSPMDDGADDSGARESSRHAAGEVERNRPKQQLRKIEREIQAKEQLKMQLGSLLKYDGEQLAVYAAGLDLPDNPVREIHPRYMEAKRKHEELKLAGMGDAHPTVKTQKETLDALKRELDEGVVNLRESLTAQLKLLENRPPSAKD